MQHELIPLDAPNRWRAALDGIKHAFGHTWESCRAFSSASGYPTFLYRFEADGVRVVCPITERRHDGESDICTPYGFSGFAGGRPPADLPAAWAVFARERGWVCGYIGLNPLLECEAHYAPADMYRQNELYVLDLELDEAELFQRLSENRKRQVRAWGEAEAWLHTDRDAATEFVIAQSSAFFRGRRASSVYAFAPEMWRRLLALPNVEVLGAAQAGRIVAVSVFAHSSGIGEYLFNISIPEGKDASAPLLWAGALRLRAQGVSVLNLGGGIYPGDGVAEFKRRFGARALPLGCLKQVYRPECFADLCRRAGVDPSRRDGYFPPYRAPGAS